MGSIVNSNYLLFKFFIYFCLVCVVLCASQKSHQKREIHRIVLKERSPRSHKKHVTHSHNHSRKRGHKNKVKKDSDESVSGSFEDSSSNEDSFEEIFNRHKSHQKQNHKKQQSYQHPRFPPNLDIEESRHHSFRDDLSPFSNSEWIPLRTDYHHSSSENHHHSSIQDHRREKDRRIKRKPKKHSHNKAHNNKNKPYGIEFTTSFPSLQFDASTFFPPIDVISNFQSLNKNVLQTNPSSILPISLEQSTVKDTSDNLKNHKTSYDVTEGHASDLRELILVPDQPEFSPIDFGPTEKDLGGHGPRNRGSIRFRTRSNYRT